MNCCAFSTAERPPPPDAKPSFPLLLVAVIVVCFLTVVVLVGVLYNVARKRVSGPTWFPEGFRFSANHMQPRNNLSRPAPKSVLLHYIYLHIFAIHVFISP